MPVGRRPPSRGGCVNFQNLTLAGQTITNGAIPAFMDFSTGSSAGNANIANAGILSFDHGASAGTATIQNSGSLATPIGCRTTPRATP